MAIAEACKESVWLKGLYAELCGDDSCINLFCDSQSAIYLTKDQMFRERTNHIDVKCNYVRDIVPQGKLKVCKISTHNNHVDMIINLVPRIRCSEAFLQLDERFLRRDVGRAILGDCARIRR
jgi:hypothetical protein